MRLRFAPSPTGFLHIGNARTAVINHILSQKENATLVLRIEDTDLERSSAQSEESIREDLRWLGIEWQEGPDTGGAYGPYRQSERFDIYRTYTDRLLEDGRAYRCYCTVEELEKMKQKALAEGRNEFYDGRCRTLSAEEAAAHEADGRTYTIRFRVPDNGTITLTDLIKGTVTFESANIGGDFIIVRSDGVPVYNYIVVIDDSLMQITHVVRGEDHLSNTPKQLLIAQALGFSPPHYAHMPLVMGDDRKKLSKRHGITSVALYRKEGYLPEALYNYIAMLGWSLESGDEIAEKRDINTHFRLDRLGGSAAIFDFKKLKWMNGLYIRSKTAEELYDLFHPYAREAGYDFDSYNRNDILTLLSTLKRYCDLLGDIGEYLPVFLDDTVQYPDDVRKTIQSDDGRAVVRAALSLFGTVLTPENFSQDAVNRISEKTGLKGKSLFMSSRAVITGRLHGPDLAEMMQAMGYDRCVSRIRQADSISG
ncbi:MAG: glutamate--tRNA ligase [Spirochaetota bacterium]